MLLLNVWRALVQRDGERAPRLVIVGQRGWECEQVLDLLDRCEALRGFVLERQGCDDTELATLLAHAQALLFPSFAEGYGMPMVEALAAGVPVLASDLPAFREVAGDVPEYLDPLDGPGWIRAIDDYVHMNGARRRAQLARMHGWQAPTWKAHFDQVHALMRRCLSTDSL
ncbi:MAG: glycosyltransferase [Comamonas sp.]